jgi:putative phosphoribosyl transferase
MPVLHTASVTTRDNTYGPDDMTTFRLEEFLPNVHVFRDRTDAGAQLAERLVAYQRQDVLVLGIPRGGVPVAAQVARKLDAELDIVVARKLGAPFQPELAIGAVTANGGRYLNAMLMQEAGVTEAYLAAVTARETAEAHRREERFRGTRRAPRVEGRIVIIVDDGLATGATMRAAVRSLRKHQPARLIVAIPVGAPETCDALRAEADDVVVLHEPEPFLAVGLYYGDFSPTDEQEIEVLLQASQQRLHAGAAPVAGADKAPPDRAA